MVWGSVDVCAEGNWEPGGRRAGRQQEATAAGGDDSRRRQQQAAQGGSGGWLPTHCRKLHAVPFRIGKRLGILLKGSRAATRVSKKKKTQRSG